MRIDPQYIQGLVGALNQNTAQQQLYSTEVATGVSVNNLSDNPAAAAQDFLLRSQQSTNDSFVQTANGVTGNLQVADTALASVVTQITQAISLATEGNNGTSNSSNRIAIANQLAGIRQEVLATANTGYQGQYLFAGSRTSTQPFSLDATTTPATVAYSGDSVQSKLQSPSGQSYILNLPGDQVFGSGSTGVLATLSNLIAEFSTGNSSSATISSASALGADLQTVSQQRVNLDNSLSSVQASSTYTQSQTTQLLATENSLIQANTAQVATQLSSADTQHTALLDVIASLDQQNTLFSVLK